MDTQGELKRANVKNNKDGKSNEPPVKVTEVSKSKNSSVQILIEKDIFVLTTKERFINSN